MLPYKIKQWFSNKINSIMNVKDNSNRKEVDLSGEVLIRSKTAAEKIEKKSLNLSSTEWISLRRMRAPEDNINCYDFLREVRCRGIVAFVPFRFTDDIFSYGNLEVLIRMEATPCWNYTNPVPSSFTGGIDEGDTPLQTVLKELKEEAGYIVDKSKLISLGQCFGPKSADTIYYLYGVDLQNTLLPTEKLTIESELEKSSYNEWRPFHDSFDIPDSIYNVVAFRLMYYLIHTKKITNSNV